MIVDEVLRELATSNKPEARALHKGLNSKTQLFGFKKGMSLKQHEVHMETTVFVLEGRIIYKDVRGREKTLDKYHSLDLPVEVVHTLEAGEDSLCLMIQG